MLLPLLLSSVPPSTHLQKVCVVVVVAVVVVVVAVAVAVTVHKLEISLKRTERPD